MPSWRSEVSERAQEDLDAVLDAALLTAERAVREQGTFYPFGVVRTADGELALVGAAEPDERPDAEAVIGDLWGALQDQRDDLLAAGVVTDRVINAQDQVAVQLEHREGTALEITLAYRVVADTFQPGELRAAAGTSRVW